MHCYILDGKFVRMQKKATFEDTRSRIEFTLSLVLGKKSIPKSKEKAGCLIFSQLDAPNAEETRLKIHLAQKRES